MVVLSATIIMRDSDCTVFLPPKVSLDLFHKFVPKEKLLDKVTDDCPICLDKIAEEGKYIHISAFRCGHIIHNNCYNSAVMCDHQLVTCPYCRSSLHKRCIEHLTTAFSSIKDSDVIDSFNKMTFECFYDFNSISLMNDYQVEKLFSWLLCDNLDLIDSIMPFMLNLIKHLTHQFAYFMIFLFETVSPMRILSLAERSLQNNRPSDYYFKFLASYLRLFHDLRYQLEFLQGRRYSKDTFRFYKANLKKVLKRVCSIITTYKGVNQLDVYHACACEKEIKQIIKSDILNQNFYFIYQFILNHPGDFIRRADQEMLDQFTSLLDEDIFGILVGSQTFFPVLFKHMTAETPKEFRMSIFSCYKTLMDRGCVGFDFDLVKRLDSPLDFELFDALGIHTFFQEWDKLEDL